LRGERSKSNSLIFIRKNRIGFSTDCFRMIGCFFVLKQKRDKT